MGNMDMMREETLTRGLPVVSPANMIPVQVMHREVVAPGVVTVYIVLPGAQQASAPYLPGQFVTLALPTPRETLYRSYSLCGDGDADQPWSLTIKRLLASRRFPPDKTVTTLESNFGYLYGIHPSYLSYPIANADTTLSSSGHE